MNGFVIQCLNCGEVYNIKPGLRNHRKETITFGTDNYGSDHISCECGNAIEEYSRFEDEPFKGDFIVEWKCISK